MYITIHGNSEYHSCQQVSAFSRIGDRECSAFSDVSQVQPLHWCQGLWPWGSLPLYCTIQPATAVKMRTPLGDAYDDINLGHEANGPRSSH